MTARGALRRGLLISVTWCAVSSCSAAGFDSETTQHPTVTIPHRFGEGKQDPAPAQAAPVEGAAPAESRPNTPENKPADGAAFHPETAPEPPTSLSAQYWEYEFAHRNGEVVVAKTTARRFEQPTAMPKKLGRFWVELWIGRELLERVRFDFPLMAGEEVPEGPARPLDAPTRFAPGANVRQTVWVPALERARRAELVDSATGSRSALPWPPGAPVEPFAPAQIPEAPAASNGDNARATTAPAQPPQ